MKNDGRKSIRYEPIHFKYLFFVGPHVSCILLPMKPKIFLSVAPFFLLMAWSNPCKFSLENSPSSTSISLLRFSKISLDIMLSVRLTFEGDIPNISDTSDSLCRKRCQYITMAMASSVDTFKESTL